MTTRPERVQCNQENTVAHSKAHACQTDEEAQLLDNLRRAHLAVAKAIGRYQDYLAKKAIREKN